MTVIIALLILAGLLAISGIALLMVGLKLINRLVETNKQLLIVVAGRDDKPDSLRALVASNKPPKKVIPGITNAAKKDTKLENSDYKMSIGVH